MRHILETLIFAAFIVLIWSAKLPGKEKLMDLSLKFNKPLPSYFQMSAFPLEGVTNIFAVPIENAVGTNDLDNALTLLKFNDDDNKIEHEIRLKDFLKYVGGGDLAFLPALSQETIGYAQTRRFVLINFKDNTFKKHTICSDLEETVSGVGIIDAEDMLFVFEIESSDDFADPFEPAKSNRSLRIIDLSSQQPKVIATTKLLGGKVINTWSVQGKTIFIYSNLNLEALNTNLGPVQHPLAVLCNKHKEIKINHLHIHPSLPFAVIEGAGLHDGSSYGAWLATWREGEVPQIVPMIKQNNKSSYSDFQFSPDGNWMIYKEVSKGNTRFIVVSVDSKLPCFLHTPKLLIGQTENPGTTAWISNPLSFVVNDSGNKIYKWNLTLDLSQ